MTPNNTVKQSDHNRKVIVITGANRGIGFEVARKLAKDTGFYLVPEIGPDLRLRQQFGHKKNRCSCNIFFSFAWSAQRRRRLH